MKNRLASAVFVYTMIFIMWHNSGVKAQEIDTIELNTKYIDQTIMDILPKEPKPQVRNTKISDLDLVLVTRAIAHAESGNGRYAKNNNICNIMEWPNGKRQLVSFSSYQAGFDACYSLLKRKYSDYTIPSMAKLYTGNDNPETWTNNAIHWYEKYSL